MTRKRFLPVVVILFLSSCIEVKDFGAYWDKGFLDPALAGSWKKIGIPGQALDDTPGADTLRFTKEGLIYSLQYINPVDKTLAVDVVAQMEKDNESSWAVRTLKIGNHVYFMRRPKEGKPDGNLERYEIKGDILQEYMNGDSAIDLVTTKYPTAKNIKKNIGEGRYLVVQTFDDEVFQILSEISDPSYWYLVNQYRKIP
jgi:hypothetical protein